jgi:hypothetical protein
MLSLVSLYPAIFLGDLPRKMELSRVGLSQLASFDGVDGEFPSTHEFTFNVGIDLLF